MIERRRRIFVVLLLVILTSVVAVVDTLQNKSGDYSSSSVESVSTETSSPVIEALGKLAVKGRAPKTGYEREKFSDGWGEAGACDVRNFIMNRDMTSVVTVSATDCTVMQGSLLDPYTGKTILFVRGPGTSDDVQVDHVVALSNAWQTGAQQLSVDQRYNFANDPLNLLAVDGPANQQKSDADAATWLPSNKDYRCRYVARQIAVKLKYMLWVTPAEHGAMEKVLDSCPGQSLPVVNPS